MRAFTLLVMIPAIALAQAFPTDFPAGAVALESDALKKRVTGKTFRVKPADGVEYEILFQDSHAVVNIFGSRGVVSDSAPWRVEGSATCIDFTKLRPGCTEFRVVGDVLYSKRASNGEVVVMQPK